MKLTLKFNNNGWASFRINEKSISISALTGFSRCVKPIKESLVEALEAIKNDKNYTLYSWCEGCDLVIQLSFNSEGYTFSANILDEDAPYRLISKIHEEVISKLDLEQTFQDLLSSIKEEDYNNYIRYCDDE